MDPTREKVRLDRRWQSARASLSRFEKELLQCKADRDSPEYQRRVEDVRAAQERMKKVREDIVDFYRKNPRSTPFNNARSQVVKVP